jgi:hypothetical protein
MTTKNNVLYLSQTDDFRKRVLTVETYMTAYLEADA